jgi:hypothetical protein
VTSAIALRSSQALATRESLLSYPLAVEWSESDRWRGSQVLLPDGRSVAVDQYVGENFKRPRVYHPEYAMAIELLLANVSTEAKRRGFDIVSAELGIWAYKTLVHMGKRVAKVGLPFEMTREDGRTKTRKGYQWIGEGMGIYLLPWPNGDQQIRFQDERGVYVVPITEATADATKCRQFFSWREVQRYPQLAYEQTHPWESVPLLGEADEMVKRLPCEGFCQELKPIQGTVWRSDKTWQWDYWTQAHPGAPRVKRSMTFKGTGKRWCRPCHDELRRIREEAANQGWNYDERKPIQLPKEFNKEPDKCAHKWGRQMSGHRNIILPNGEIEHGMTIRWECIHCGTPTPREHMSDEDVRLQTEQELRRYRKRKRT